MLRKTFCLIHAMNLRTLMMFAMLLPAFLYMPGNVRAQEKGFQPGASYALSDIEAINASNGNMIVQIPLASLPPGRGGVPGPELKLVYNSKLYETHTENIPDAVGNVTTQIFLNPGPDGGWRYSTNFGYTLNLISRLNFEDPYPCSCDFFYQKNAYIWKLTLTFPDGGEHEFRPVGFTDRYSDGYFDVDPTGKQNFAGCTGSSGLSSCNFTQSQATTNGMTYYSTDGTFMRLFVPYPGSGTTGWTLSFPDGRQLITTASGQTMYDRNNNIIPMGFADGLGRQITMTQNGDEDHIFVTGANNQQLEWIVKWKTIFVSRPYIATSAGGGRERGPSSEQVLTNEARVVERITLPIQAGGLTYIFGYSASDTDVWPAYSPGWGELNSITLPTGARADYKWNFDADSIDFPGRPPNWDWVLNNHPVRKDLTYLREYDLTSTPVTETWTYMGNFRIGGSFTVTAPDGGVTQTSSFGASTNSPFVGLAFKTTFPDGSETERVWRQNRPQGIPIITKAVNPFVQREFHTIRNAAGALSKTAITDYRYDKNGNVTRVDSYDWVDYSSLTRDANGDLLIPGSAVLKRRVTTNYHAATPDANDSSTINNNVYHILVAPRLLNAVKDTEVSGGGAALSRTEFVYDNPFETGNLVQVKSWDSTKGAYSNPLVPANSISVLTEYNSYGSPTMMTDAKGIQTKLTYGAINGHIDLYPTKTETAFNTPLKKTGTRVYDFNTGLVTVMRDEDNGVSSVTSFDDMGRTTLIRSAADLPEETRISTQYFDAERRVVVRSDQDSKGDGKLVSIQHYDQLGRVRLTRRLEQFSTAGLTDERIGIKIQVRYFIDNPCQPTNAFPCLTENSAVLASYVLTSNPYRAQTSSEASGEPTMGWSRGRSDRTGRQVEVQTFAGADLPAPWDDNNSSTGTVTRVHDGHFTTVTDQAGKPSRSMTDALGRMVRVDEVSDSSNTIGDPSSPTQATNYIYDALGNLKQITQGQQSRFFNYTSLSRLKDSTSPEGGTISYEYDATGNITTKTDPRLLPNTSTHVSIVLDYDQLNRLKSRTYNDGTPTVTYSYDNPDVLFSKGRLTSISSSSSSYTYEEYDATGRVKKGMQTTAGQSYTMEYTYNRAGALVSQKYPSGLVVKSEYDDAGRLAGVKKDANNFYYAGGSPSSTNQFQYSPAGAVEGMRLGNDLWEHTNFNSRLQTVQIGVGNSVSDSSKLRLDYTFGVVEGGNLNPAKNNGNPQSQTITLPGVAPIVQNYDYDELGRLKKAQELGTNGWTEEFSYDRFGNRTAVSLTQLQNHPLPTTAPEVDPQTNRFKTTNSQNQATGYDYDDAGNLTKEPEASGSFKNYSYDSDNRIKQAKRLTGGNEVVIGDYVYDGDGKRVKTIVGAVTTIYVYNIVGQLVAEYTDGSTVNGGTSFITSDALGSTRLVTGSNKEVKERHDYLPFGEEIPAAYSSRSSVVGFGIDNVRQKFTGKERDIETGLDFFGARYLASAHGRFVAPDPLLSSGSITDPQTWNRYGYVLNNPLRFVDPTGLFTWSRELGGDADDTELEEYFRQEAEKIKDAKKRKKALEKVKEKAENARKKREEVRAAIRHAESLLFSDRISAAEKGEISSAIKAYGEENTSNLNVIIDVREGRNAGATFAEGGRIIVGLGLAGNDKQTAVQFVHEGSHVADMQRFNAYESGSDLTLFETERRAWTVGAYAAKGFGMDSYPGTLPENLQVWRKGWSQAEIETGVRNRLAGVGYELTPDKPGQKFTQGYVENIYMNRNRLNKDGRLY